MLKLRNKLYIRQLLYSYSTDRYYVTGFKIKDTEIIHYTKLFIIFLSLATIYFVFLLRELSFQISFFCCTFVGQH